MPDQRKVVAALMAFQICAEAVEQLWEQATPADIESLEEGYPKCLPSFDEFVEELNAWQNTQTRKLLGGKS